MRVPAGDCRVQPDQLQQLGHPARTRLGGPGQPVHLQRLGDALRRPCGAGPATRTGPGRPSPRGGAARAAGAGTSAVTSAPSKVIRPAGRVDQPQQRHAGGRLAAAGLPDQAERLAAPDVEVDAVDRPHAADRPGQPPGPGSAPSRLTVQPGGPARPAAHVTARCSAGDRVEGADRVPGADRRSGGSSFSQRGSPRTGQRGQNAHPGGQVERAAAARREWPARSSPPPRRAGGRARRAAPGCTGAPARSKTASTGPSSTIRPPYITATRVGDAGDHAEVVGDPDDRRCRAAAAGRRPAR